MLLARRPARFDSSPWQNLCDAQKGLDHARISKGELDEIIGDAGV
jgi:hypothetical protein